MLAPPRRFGRAFELMVFKVALDDGNDEFVVVIRKPKGAYSPDLCVRGRGGAVLYLVLETDLPVHPAMCGGSQKIRCGPQVKATVAGLKSVGPDLFKVWAKMSN